MGLTPFFNRYITAISWPNYYSWTGYDLCWSQLLASTWRFSSPVSHNCLNWISGEGEGLSQRVSRPNSHKGDLTAPGVEPGLSGLKANHRDRYLLRDMHIWYKKQSCNFGLFHSYYSYPSSHEKVDRIQYEARTSNMLFYLYV